MMAGIKYKLGPQFKVAPKELDCFGMVVRFIKLRYNYLLPSKFDGRPVLDWYQECDWDKTRLIPLFIKYLEAHFSLINKNYRKAGDILVADEDSGEPTIGIHSGVKKMLICTPEKGITTVSTTNYVLSKVFRWADQ